MALTAQQVIDAARDLSPYFDDSRIPGGTAARMLSDVQRHLVARGSRADPDLLVSTEDVALAFGSAITLSAHETVLRVNANWLNADHGPSPVPMIQVSRVPDFECERACYLIGADLYLTGTAATWSGVDDLTVYYTALAGDISDLTTALVLPDDAKEALAYLLAARFALRVNGMPIQGSTQRVEVDVNGLAQQGAAAETAWIERVVHQRQRQMVTQFAP